MGYFATKSHFLAPMPSPPPPIYDATIAHHNVRAAAMLSRGRSGESRRRNPRKCIGFGRGEVELGIFMSNGRAGAENGIGGESKAGLGIGVEC